MTPFLPPFLPHGFRTAFYWSANPSSDGIAVAFDGIDHDRAAVTYVPVTAFGYPALQGLQSESETGFLWLVRTGDAVPEPAGLTVVAVGALTLFSRTRRKRG